MKKIILLQLIACVLAMHAATAQLATKVSADNPYGKVLFTDGSTLYEISNDTLNSLSTGTGARTFIDKLPAPPPGGYVVKWGKTFAVKAAPGFMITQELQMGASSTTRIWANTGAGWDTIATGPTAPISEPMLMGSKYALYVGGTTAGTSLLLRTDFTRAGTTVEISSSNLGFLRDFKRGTDRIYFSYRTSSASSISTAMLTLYYMDDHTLQALDSGNIAARPLATLGNDVYYMRQHETVTTTSVHDQSLRKWDAAAGTSTVLVPGISYSTDFPEGASFGGKIIATKIDSGKSAQSLVAIDPATGAQTYLTTAASGTVFPIYFLEYSGYGAGHAYIFTRDSSAYATTITDGATTAGTSKPYTSEYSTTFDFAKQGTRAPGSSIICNDDAFGNQASAAGGNAQLYHLSQAGAIEHQDLNDATSFGSMPANFVQVSGEIFFTASQAAGGFPTGRNDLWKITSCATLAATAIPAAEAAYTLYPNPAADQLTIKLKYAATARMDLYDMTGRLVMTSQITNGHPVSVAALNNGIYLCRITINGTMVHTERVSIFH